jgi:hypothetical protein
MEEKEKKGQSKGLKAYVLPVPQTLTPRDWSLALGFCVLVVFLGALQMVPGVTGIFLDDGVYVSTAKALATGQGYRLINLPWGPLQTKYPPLYPAMLALAWKVWPAFPDNLVLMQGLTLVCGGAMIGLSYLYLVRFGYCSRGVAAVAAALTLTSSWFLYYYTLTLSEMPFALLSIAALWCLERQNEGRWARPSGQVALGLILSLPALTRIIGFVFIPWGFYLRWRERKPLVWVSLGAAVALAPWLLWMVILPRWSASDAVTTYQTNYLAWWYTYVGKAYVWVILKNFYYLMSGATLTAISLLNNRLINSWFWPLHLALGLATWFFVALDAGKGRVLPGFLLSCFVLFLVWPFIPTRFLIPILPFLLAYLFQGTWQFFSRISPKFHPRVLACFAVAGMLVANLTVTGMTIRQNHRHHYPFCFPVGGLASWASYEEVFSWLRNNTQTNDVIVSGLDNMIYLYTGRQTICPFMGNILSLYYGQGGPALNSWQEIRQMINRYQPRYLVRLPMPLFSQEKPIDALLIKLQKRCPGFLRPVYVGSDRRFVIFAVNPKATLNCGDLE